MLLLLFHVPAAGTDSLLTEATEHSAAPVAVAMVAACSAHHYAKAVQLIAGHSLQEVLLLLFHVPAAGTEATEHSAVPVAVALVATATSSREKILWH